jgi:hypothetical protein
VAAAAAGKVEWTRTTPPSTLCYMTMETVRVTARRVLVATVEPATAAAAGR